VRSNWTQRPLEEEQLAYAALDAHCCVLIFDKLLMQLKGQPQSSTADRWERCIKKSAVESREEEGPGGRGGGGRRRSRWRGRR
jgi:ribonuclease D